MSACICAAKTSYAPLIIDVIFLHERGTTLRLERRDAYRLGKDGVLVCSCSEAKSSEINLERGSCSETDGGRKRVCERTARDLQRFHIVQHPMSGYSYACGSS